MHACTRHRMCVRLRALVSLLPCCVPRSVCTAWLTLGLQQVFATYQCYSFDGRIHPDDYAASGPLAPHPMLQPTRWLKADLSINCDEPRHKVRGGSTPGSRAQCTPCTLSTETAPVHSLSLWLTCASLWRVRGAGDGAIRDRHVLSLPRRDPRLLCVHVLLAVYAHLSRNLPHA